MNRDEVADELQRLAADYRHLYDGGYAMVKGIRKWAKTLDPDSRRHLWDCLVESVSDEESRMWGIAIAVLVEEHPNGIAERLNELLTRHKASEEWKNEIIFSLLCLGYRPAAAKCFQYIREGLRGGKGEVNRLLAASCRVDPKECLALASKHFGRVLRLEGTEDEYRYVIPTYVRHFLKADELLLTELVERTKTVDVEAAKRLAALLDEYFTRPWNVQEFGEAKTRALREQIGGHQSDLKSEYPL
jgi:hypothetical protein